MVIRFAREDVGGPNSFHDDLLMKLSESELEQMWRLRAHLDKVGRTCCLVDTPTGYGR